MVCKEGQKLPRDVQVAKGRGTAPKSGCAPRCCRHLKSQSCWSLGVLFCGFLPKGTLGPAGILVLSCMLTPQKMHFHALTPRLLCAHPRSGQLGQPGPTALWVWAGLAVRPKPWTFNIRGPHRMAFLGWDLPWRPPGGLHGKGRGRRHEGWCLVPPKTLLPSPARGPPLPSCGHYRAPLVSTIFRLCLNVLWTDVTGPSKEAVTAHWADTHV